MALQDIPYVQSIDFEVRQDPKGQLDQIVVVYTDLVLDCTEQGFDSSALDDLLASLTSEIQKAGFARSIVLRRAR